jgi:Domain of unknown function (DUF4386)
VNLQKSGGIAALIEAFAYIVGFIASATVLNPGNVSSWSAVEKLAFVLDKKALFQLSNICIYVIFGIALVVLALSLHERLQAKANGMMKVATALGLIWAGLVIASGMIGNIGLDAVARIYAQNPEQAALAWRVISAVQDGLGGGVEIVGGVWLVLISLAALHAQQFSKPLNWLGVLVGMAGVLTAAPPLADMAIIFGLGQIIWFAWLAVLLLRTQKA